MNGRHFVIKSRTLDDQTWLISYYSDIFLGKYYIYERSHRKLTFLFDSRPELKEYNMVPMKPVIIPSRDGLKMMSYLTLPQNSKLNVPMPMVLAEHGGPHIRDSWGFNAYHQFLANRGYAVLRACRQIKVATSGELL